MQGITRKQVNEAVSYQDEIRKIDAKKEAEADDFLAEHVKVIPVTV